MATRNQNKRGFFHRNTDTPQRQGPGEIGSAYQAEEFIDQYDEEAIPPGESKGLTSSSSPGQSLHRNRPPFPAQGDNAQTISEEKKESR